MIPTLNRPKAVTANLKSIINSLNEINPSKQIEILLSENFSEPDKQLKKKTINSIKASIVSNNIHFHFKRRSKRLPLGAHMIRLAKSVKCKWITWIGDDDLISTSYLDVILDVVSKDDCQVQSIYPGCNVITEKEFFKIANSNIYEKKLKLTFNKQSSSKIEDIVYRGHQLTGLVYRYNVIEDSFNVLPEDNLYPWICFQSVAIRKGIVISVSGSSVKVTGDTQKLFSYRKDDI